MNPVVDGKGAAGLILELAWTSGEAAHCERLRAPVDLWGDILPPRLLAELAGQEQSAVIEQTLTPAESVPEPSTGLVRTAPWNAFAGGEIQPRAGRFYPRRLLSGVPGVAPGSLEPFRCLRGENEGFALDLNHPLAGHELTLTVTVEQPSLDEQELTGRSIDWISRLCTGPGMQARAEGQPTDFWGGDALLRDDEAPDIDFYEKPRLVGHLDSQASAHIAALYGELLQPGNRVLDLMAAYQSHLPAGLELGGVTGLGLNLDEMAANPALDGRVIHDLNAEPRLPFDDDSFDAVVCTASVEYLNQPREVFADLARVLAPGGVLAVTFSNRFFPPKAVRVWKELHDFEKMGLVLDYFLETGRFGDLATLSARGWPRPADDRHHGEYPASDPVYGVWGRRE
ncbi:MAG: methyltransferase domain-containing protein [Desulfarculaceae bacterium]|nr:methyltransferase domain-containing protein [Desulfarculaceae bacterium]MCF8072168.1 methyltransferase domain-containing protein [Desulfarculaceae bacterium]MCF8100089.1 methyltransferase domain-containing protein [Desulfarculaceae bacterium]MCF8117936.1 methyltransferase domain-containing protein [Desulfarculaceae bacterium]